MTDRRESEAKPVAMPRAKFFADVKRRAKDDTEGAKKRLVERRALLRNRYPEWAPQGLLNLFPQLGFSPESQWHESARLAHLLSSDRRMQSIWGRFATLPFQEGQTQQNREWEVFCAIEDVRHEAERSRWQRMPAGERRSTANRIVRGARKLAGLLGGTPYDVTIPEVLEDDTIAHAFGFLRDDVSAVITLSDFGPTRALGNVLFGGKPVSGALNLLADRVKTTTIPKPRAPRARSQHGRKTRSSEASRAGSKRSSRGKTSRSRRPSRKLQRWFSV